MNTEYLGKIEDVKIGFGGYQDSMLGITIQLAYESFRSCDFIAWSETDKIEELLYKCDKTDLNDLKSMPVKVIISDLKLSSWRILKEVL